MMYMKYPRGDNNNWVPKIIANIEVRHIKVIRKNLVSTSGFRYHMCQAQISDEDATYISLVRDPKYKHSVKISSNPFRNDK